MSKEIQQIIEKINTLAPNEKAILATVVDVEGSGYRRPGARMLIDREGFGIGTVSGGCLEADVLERAKNVFATGEAALITYDTRADENSVFGLGMGCRGVVRIMLEIVSKDSFFFNYLSDALSDRTMVAIATEIASEGGKNIGRRFYFNENGVVSSEFDEQETIQLFRVMRPALYERRTALDNLGFGEIFIETIAPPVKLLLFGAGHDALPLVRFAKDLGWSVSIVDHRPAYADASRIPEADEIFVARIDELDAEIFEDENSVAVVMTHNYERDREILPRLLESSFLYVGALGPKSRTDKIIAETNTVLNSEQSARLHAPVGLDIGADTPETIALAIVAEIFAALKNRAGGFLRARQGSIYDRKSS